MVKIVLLWIAGIILGFFGIVVRALYRPGKKAADLCMTLFLLFMLAFQLAAIYYTALDSPLAATVAVMIFIYYWSYFAPFYPNSDAAGNGMARGFRSCFITMASFIWGVASFFLMKFLVPDGMRLGLYIVLAVAALVGLCNLFANRRSYLSGDSLAEDARWACMRVDDYRKSLFRYNMVEKNDSWEAKELDAEPKELEHWNVDGCKSIKVTTYGQRECLLIKGCFELSNDTVSVRRTGFYSGCLGYTDGEDRDDLTSFVPQRIELIWHDLAERKTYKIETGLPKELDRYFSDTERFRLDDIEFRLMPAGRVLIYHNRHNQIHNIMIDHFLQGEVTNEYEQDVSELLKEETGYKKAGYKKTGDKKTGDGTGEAINMPSSNTVNDYLRRFRYTLSFCPEGGRFTITKTICNFFNGEKILSAGVWKEEPEPARVKDVFLRFEDESDRYSCFVYFSEEEILRVFEEVFRDKSDSVVPELCLRIGNRKSDFSFGFKRGAQYYPLKSTEIRLYKNNQDDGGKLVFKNYKGRHKNVLKGM